MTHAAAGTFEVKLTPQSVHDAAQSAAFARLSIAKTFAGDLAATSVGEMLAIPPGPTGSGVYVAIERVTGTLGGKRGTFALHHTGLMTRGAPTLDLRVVPESGTDELAGLTGSMRILIEGRNHSYEFEYAFETPA